MPALATKPKPISGLLANIKKQHEQAATVERPVLEHMLYAVIRENASRAEADRAFSNLTERFFDWNEVRVSSPHEVAGAFAHLPQPVAKAARIVALLQEVFEAHYSFDLEGLPKKGLQPAVRQVARYQASSDFVVAWVKLHCLDGHSIPIDAPTLKALKRLGVIEEDADNLATVQASLEHQIPKAKAAAFVEMINCLAHEEREERRNRTATDREPVRASRPKPR